MVITKPLSTQLRLVFYDGEDVETGKPIYRNKNFNNVKNNATDEQLFHVALAFESLQQSPVSVIERRDASEILEE